MNNDKLLFLAIFIGGMFWALGVEAVTVSPSRIEFFLNPGQRAEETVKLANETENEIALYTSVSNFRAKEGEEGVPEFYDLKDEDGLAKWIETKKGPIVLAPGETRVVPFTLSVPVNAEPGGHYAGLFFQTRQEDAKFGVGLSEKIGMLILLRVSGDLKEEGKLVKFSLKDDKTYYERLPVSFRIGFENSGNTHLKPKGEIKINNIFGLTEVEIPVNKDKITGGKNVLPSTTRHFESVWTKGPLLQEEKKGLWGNIEDEMNNFALGRYTAVLNLKYGSENKEFQSETVFWVFPWHLIIFSILVSSAAVLTLVGAVKVRDRRIIAKAIKEQQKKEQKGE